jgi:predicted RNase H-like nuclease (RuvC/YqgF family)
MKMAYFFSRIRELEAENTRLKDKLAVDEIKLNLVMSCETQFMSPSMTKTLTDLKNKLSERETQIGQLRKRLRSEEHRSQNQTLQRDAGEAVVELCEAHFQCAVCNELLVKATGLQCGHVFCRDCVNKWKKKSESSTDLRGKKATCPICRSEIVTQAPLKNIDAFLEKAVEIFFTDEAKKSRKELLSLTTGPAAVGSSSSDAAFLRYVYSSGGHNRPQSSTSTRQRIQRGANRSPPFVILDDD